MCLDMNIKNIGKGLNRAEIKEVKSVKIKVIYDAS